MEVLQSLDSVPGDGEFAPSEGTQNENSNTGSGVQDSISLQELSTLTGRSYTSKDDALKGIRQTYSYVGTKKESTPEMYGYTAREIFTLKHPETGEVVDKIMSMAKAMKELPEKIYEDFFKDALHFKQEAQDARENSIKETSVDSINVSSDNKISPFNANKRSLDDMSIEELKQVATNALKQAK